MKKFISTLLVLLVLLASLTACDQAAATNTPGTTAQQTTVPTQNNVPDKEIVVIQTLPPAAIQTTKPVTTEKPLKLYDSRGCKGVVIEDNIATYEITPPGFDLYELDKKGYKMTIEIVFDVHYEKTWNVPLDIGYLGAPKYETYILNEKYVASKNENVTANANTQKSRISYTTDIVNLINSKIYFKVSSDNIQNAIHFENIKVYYDCFKP